MRWAERTGDLDVEFVRVIDHGEEVGGGPEGFGGAQHEEAAGTQGVMEQRDDAPLHDGVEVDEHVVAADQVQVGERRVSAEIVLGEGAQLADGVIDLVVDIDLGKEASQPLGRDIELDVFDIEARAGLRQGALIQVGGEQADRDLGGVLAQRLQHADGEGVGLFPGGAPRHPEAQRRVRGARVEGELRQERRVCSSRLSLMPFFTYDNTIAGRSIRETSRRM